MPHTVAEGRPQMEGQLRGLHLQQLMVKDPGYQCVDPELPLCDHFLLGNAGLLPESDVGAFVRASLFRSFTVRKVRQLKLGMLSCACSTVQHAQILRGAQIAAKLSVRTPLSDGGNAATPGCCHILQSMARGRWRQELPGAPEAGLPRDSFPGCG